MAAQAGEVGFFVEAVGEKYLLKNCTVEPPIVGLKDGIAHDGVAQHGVRDRQAIVRRHLGKQRARQERLKGALPEAKLRRRFRVDGAAELRRKILHLSPIGVVELGLGYFRAANGRQHGPAAATKDVANPPNAKTKDHDTKQYLHGPGFDPLAH